MATNKAIDDVLAERARQIEKGYTASHDDGHSAGEIAEACCSVLLLHARGHSGHRDMDDPDDWIDYLCAGLRGNEEQVARRRLVIAAALAIAEIERLDRAKEATNG